MAITSGELWWAYLLVGLVSGIFSASFGVGSGVILVPALVLLFAFPQKSAQATCLAVMVPMALVGAIGYKINAEVVFHPLALTLLACGAVIGAMVGASIAGWAPAAVLRKLFALIMLAAAVQLFFTAPSRPVNGLGRQSIESNRSRPAAPPAESR